MKNRFIILLSVLALGCKKDPPSLMAGVYENGLVILNEGLHQQNNASISFYSKNEGKSYQQVFSLENNRGLGDTANDMELYSLNGKHYIIIAVDVSSQIEIVDAHTLKSLAQISLFDGNTARQPRYVSVKGTKAYSCNYDGTVSVINLLTNTLSNTIEVGANPDGMAIIGSRLYVSNSGGLNYPIYDSTISVIDLNTESIQMVIQARINCRDMLADNQGDLYVNSFGNYSNVDPALLRIDSQSNTIIDSFDVTIREWCFYNDWIYYYEPDLQGIYRFNTLSETFENIALIDCSSHDIVYGLFTNGLHIITADANGYVNSSTIRVYDMTGDYQFEIPAGLNANDLVFN